MHRLDISPRYNWRRAAWRFGFSFHTLHNTYYWFENAAYIFTLQQIEQDIEASTIELTSLCYQVVERASCDEEVLLSLGIPPSWWESIRVSWKRGDRDLYARFDFSYDGYSHAKLLELNADTPTSLFETAFFQWLWIEEASLNNLVPYCCDQFNSLQEVLINALSQMFPDWLVLPGSRTLHFISTMNNEDRDTLNYVMDCAHQAGITIVILDVAEIGIDQYGRFTDTRNHVITTLFKLYPWEWLVTEPFVSYLLGNKTLKIIEPCWKMVLSTKGLLPWLWRMFPGHPNLLPSWFLSDPAAQPGAQYVIKPLLSREGANIYLMDNVGDFYKTNGSYGTEGWIIQDYHPLPTFIDMYGKQHHAIVGSWIVNGRPCGIGIREDNGPIISDTSRFVPHIILPT